MAIIPSFFMDAVIALGIDTGTNNKHWIRTLPIKDKTENNILLCSYPKFFPL